MSKQRDRAVQLLTHYFRTVFEAAGLKFTADNATEVEEIVDEIVDIIETEDATLVERIEDIEKAISKFGNSMPWTGQ